MQSTDSPKDRLAADLILTYLEDHGLSPEGFSRAAFNSGHGYVSGKRIRQIVEEGVVPKTNRVRSIIAAEMGFATPRSVWRNAPVVAGRKVGDRRKAAA